MTDPLPQNRRIYVFLRSDSTGLMHLLLTTDPLRMDNPAGVFLWRGELPGGALDLPLVARPGVASVGTATLAQSTTVGIAAGVRQLTIPAAGVAPGDNILVFPTDALPAGYALHGAVATSAGRLQVTFTAPVLAVGAGFSIALRVVRVG